MKKSPPPTEFFDSPLHYALIIVGVISQKKLYKCLMFLFEANLNERLLSTYLPSIIVGAISHERLDKCRLLLFMEILNEWGWWSGGIKKRARLNCLTL